MELCLITDKTDFASEAEGVGVSRIMLDLERTGKELRQKGKDLFISDHIVGSAAPMKAALHKASLVVRINALSPASAAEIEALIEARTDLIMLPYFHTMKEVRDFLSLVRGRAKTILLIETGAAVELLPQIIKEPGVDEVHIGLNDLSISLGYTTIFEPICNGLVNNLASILRKKQIRFGFGGIARLSHTDLPVSPERILAEQVRLGASVGWLGRTFRGNMETKRRPGELAYEIDLIHKTVDKWKAAPETAFMHNMRALREELAIWERGVSAAWPASLVVAHLWPSFFNGSLGTWV